MSEAAYSADDMAYAYRRGKEDALKRMQTRREKEEACDCVPYMVSSQACPKCGRVAVISQEEFQGDMVDLSQYHYVLRQIEEGVTREEAKNMAKRVLAGERSVTPRRRGLPTKHRQRG